jgi:uncharacterized membrane protein YidH (DUF202 family)
MSTQRNWPGLQAERTRLSWERTGFVYLAGGAIPLLGRDGGPMLGATMLAGMGVLLAMLAVWLGNRRAQRSTATPRLEVLLLGWATAVFAAAVVVFVAVQAG